MKTINGIYSSATIFTINNSKHAIDDYAVAQIQMLCNNEVSKGSLIRVMPDVHPGKVGTIGLTMTIGNKIMPNLIGIDIGCGITLAKIKCKKVEFQKLDTVIRDHVPSGTNTRNNIHHLAETFDFEQLHCYKHIQLRKAKQSLGTLGSGNHFIELDKDDAGNTYLIIHSGSRHLGKEMTEYYLSEGQKALKAKGIDVPYELTYLDDELKEQYLHDLLIVHEYASLNRNIMIDELVKGMKWKILDQYDCIHNYIDTSKETLDTFGAPMLRKGAISAKANEDIIIPINMRDGVILGKGLGNQEWNASAPHGSGRILKREDVKNHVTLSNYKAEMKGIYSSCIGKDTLDESPFAYRNLNDIAEVIQDTVKIETIIKPIYNYKAGGKKIDSTD